LNMLRRLGGCNRPDVLWSTDVPCETSVCGLVKGRIDFMAQVPDRDEIRERTHQRPYGSARNVFQGQSSPGTSCCLLNLRSGEYWYYSYDSVSVDRFCSMMQLKQQKCVYQTNFSAQIRCAGLHVSFSVLINYNISMSLSDLPYDVLSIIAMRMTSTVREIGDVARHVRNLAVCGSTETTRLSNGSRKS
jgi:hypothetical protein